MERIQGAINPYFFGNRPSVVGLEFEGFLNIEKLELGEEDEVIQQFSTPSLADTMPFFSFKEPSFLALLSFQQLKAPWEAESYAIHEEADDFPSQVKSETSSLPKNTISNTCMDGVNSETNQEFILTPTEGMCREAKPGSSSPQCSPKSRIKRNKETGLHQTVTKERRKRKRKKAVKIKEEVENQRMTHIAVERNRRRQTKEHLNSPRFLMPSSYIQRRDQASIIGGAIDFMKELEQLLQSLVAQKRRKQSIGEDESTLTSSTAGDALTGISANTLNASSPQNKEHDWTPRTEATVIQNHVNLKVECPKTHGRLLKAIVSLEELRLTVLHLNVASSEASMFYSFNLKMEDDCEMKLGAEIAAAAHQIFSQIDR